MAQRLCRSCGAFHDLEKTWPTLCYGHFSTNGDPSFQIISDHTEVRSMLDGKMYDSKSALRRTYRAAGVREIGNDKQDAVNKATFDRKETRAALKDAAQQHGY